MLRLPEMHKTVKMKKKTTDPGQEEQQYGRI